jgi:hypothetical protein
VAADAAVDGDVEHLLLRAQVDLAAGVAEPRDGQVALEGREVRRGAGLRRVALVDRGGGGVVGGGVERRRVVEIDPPVLLAVVARVQGDALQALLVVEVDRDAAGDAVDAGLGVVVPDDAGARGVQDVAVGQDREVHGLAGAVVEGDLLERAGGRRGRRVVVALVGGGRGGHREEGQAEGGADGGREPCAEGVRHGGLLFPSGEEVAGGPTSNVGT